MKCIECGHDTINKNRTYVANLENCVIIIKNVPAMVCEHCNEVYYSDEVFEQIEKIVYKLESVINDIAVIDYTNSAAQAIKWQMEFKEVMNMEINYSKQAIKFLQKQSRSTKERIVTAINSLLSGIEEIEPDKTDLEMLNEIETNPECKTFVSADEAMKELGIH